MDVDDKAALEALAQAIFERLQVGWRAVRAQHDLATTVVEGVEGVEELLLGPGLVLEELNVVEQEHVDVAKVRLEGLGLSARERSEKLVGERLSGRAPHREAGTMGQDEVRDRAEQMRLAHARRAIDEERVVGVPGHLGDGECSCVGKSVAIADHEMLEGELRVAPWLRRSLAARGAQRRVSGARGPRHQHVRGRAPRPPRRADDPRRGGRAVTAAGLKLDVRVGAEHERGAGLQHAPEALADERAGLGWRFDHKPAVRQLAGTQRIEPEAVGGFIDRACELVLDPRPYVIELDVHGSKQQLLSAESV